MLVKEWTARISKNEARQWPLFTHGLRWTLHRLWELAGYSPFNVRANRFGHLLSNIQLLRLTSGQFQGSRQCMCERGLCWLCLIFFGCALFFSRLCLCVMICWLHWVLRLLVILGQRLPRESCRQHWMNDWFSVSQILCCLWGCKIQFDCRWRSPSQLLVEVQGMTLSCLLWWFVSLSKVSRFEALRCFAGSRWDFSYIWCYDWAHNEAKHQSRPPPQAVLIGLTGCLQQPP